MSVTISHQKDYIGTDELDVEFCFCRSCGFLRVPAARKNARPVKVLTANYCPGCGNHIEWVP